MIRGSLIRPSLSEGLVINSTPHSVVFFLLIIVGVQSRIIFDDLRPVSIRGKLLWWCYILFLLGSGVCAHIKCSSETPPPMLHLLRKNHLQHLPPNPEGMNRALLDFFRVKFPFWKAPKFQSKVVSFDGSLTPFGRFSSFNGICLRQVMMRFSSKIPNH